MSFIAKKEAITELGLYLTNNLHSLRTERVIEKITKIRQVFGATSHTGKLAIQTIVLIRKHESADSLDEFSLISFALMLVYERYFDSLYLKRRIIDEREIGRLSGRVQSASRPSRRRA